MKRVINFILGPYTRWQERRELAKQAAKMRGDDPFIYW
jgi:hypothetical protein